MLLLIKSRRRVALLVTVAVLALAASIAVVINREQHNSRQNVGLEDSTPETVVVAIMDRRYEDSNEKYNEANTSIDKFNALLELSTLSLERGELTEALDYSIEASALPDLSSDYKYVSLLNEIKIYMILEDYDNASGKLSELSDIESSFNQETLDYLDKVEVAIGERTEFPEIVSCADYNNDGECVQ